MAAVSEAGRVVRPFLLMKGGALIGGGIVSPWERHLDDIDIWVEPGLARDAFDSLVGAGFTPVGSSPSATHEGVASLDAPTHQLPMLRSPHGALVEIHLESHARGDAGDFDACYAAGIDVVVQGITVRVPCALHLLEQLCAHVVVHHFGDLRFWPRHVNDVRRLVEHAPELAALRNRPDEVGLSLRVAHGVDHPESADAWLARFFIDPTPATAAAWRVAAVALRTGRFAVNDPRAFLRVLVPTSPHLAFTGDLGGGRSLPAAHIRRWRRILGRAVASPTLPKTATKA
jgi:hypothetical protein